MLTAVLIAALSVSLLANVGLGLCTWALDRSLRKVDPTYRPIEDPVPFAAPLINDLGDGLIMPMPDDPRWRTEKRYESLKDDSTINFVLGKIKFKPEYPASGMSIDGLDIKGTRAETYMTAVQDAWKRNKLAAALERAMLES